MKYLIIHTKIDTCIFIKKRHYRVPITEIAFYEHFLEGTEDDCWVCAKQILGQRKRKIGRKELENLDFPYSYPIIRKDVTEEWLRDYVKGPVYSLSI